MWSTKTLQLNKLRQYLIGGKASIRHMLSKQFASSCRKGRVYYTQLIRVSQRNKTYEKNNTQNPEKYGLERQAPDRIRSLGQLPAYRHDKEVNLVLRATSQSELTNEQEKKEYNQVIKKAALGLYKFNATKDLNYRRNTEEVINFLSKNLDGRAFALLNKHLHEFRSTIHANSNKEESKFTLHAESYVPLLDKIKDLTPRKEINFAIIRKLEKCDLTMMTPKRLMQAYETNSIDFKFENKLRMGEIQKFAENSVPQPRFLFDNFKVDPLDELEQEGKSGDDNSDLSDGDAHDTDREDVSSRGYQDEDYFSFFSSHQSIILKPESSFKELQGFLTHLPIDYYVLFANEERWIGNESKSNQSENVDDQMRQLEQQKSLQFETTNYVIFDNLPLFQQRETYFKNSDPVKQLSYEDIWNSSSYNDAKKLLESTYSEMTLVEHLTKHFGEITELMLDGFNKDQILSSMGRSDKVGLDQDLQNRHAFDIEAQSRLEQEQELAKIFQKGYEGGELVADDEQIVDNDENLLDTKRMQDLEGEVRTKQKKFLNLEEHVMKRGLVKFKNYEDKLKFMDTALFLFGMKLHRMNGNVNFYDADFANTLTIKCPLFDNQTLEHCCDLVNHLLRGQSNKIEFEIGKLKDMHDFDLSKIIVRENKGIVLRLSSFKMAQFIQKFINRKHVMSGDEASTIQCSFKHFVPFYFDGKLATDFESLVKDKFDGLDMINEVRSDYVAQKMKEYNVRPKYPRFDHMLDEIDSHAPINSKSLR